MESGLLATFNEIVRAHPVWLITMAFVFALFESLAIVGLLIPGIILLFAVGAVIGTDFQLFVWCWAAAAAGALAGDVVSHWIGSHFRDQVPRMWMLRHRPEILAAGKHAVISHGGKGVVIGRFVGPLRPIVPLVAGMMSMPLRSFLVFAIPASLLWAPVYLLPGMLFGASLELAAEFAGRLVVVLLIVVLGLWLVIWLTRVIYNFTARRSGWWVKGLIRWSRRHPVLGQAVAPLFEPGRRELISVALLGLLLLISLALLLSVLVLAPFTAGAWDAERQAAGWVASLRSHYTDPVFVAVSLAGDLRVMTLLAGIMTILLVAFRRTNAAWHWLVATGGGWMLVEVLHGFMSLLIASPEAGLLPSLGEVPHRGITLATIVLGFFAVMVAKDLSASRRKWPYLGATVALALICFAHFYLARASLAGLTAAIALGSGWLALVGIGYRQRALERRSPGWLAAMFYGLFVAIAAVHVHGHHENLLEASRLAQPEREMSPLVWRETGWRELPERRSRLGGIEAQRFDLQFAGELEPLQERLEATGWQEPDPDDSARLSRLLAPQPDARKSPHLPRDFAGRPEDLLMIDYLDGQQVATLRLWDSGARLLPGREAVWLGQVRVVRPGRFLGLFNRWTEVAEQRQRGMARLLQAVDGHRALEVEEGLWLIMLE